MAEKKQWFTTEEDRELIKKLAERGMSNMAIADVVGFADSTVSQIVSGKWEEKKERDRARQAQIREARKRNRAEVQAIRERKEQESKASEHMNLEPVDPCDPFSDERLMMRIADSIDYNNALLNGLLSKITKFVEELA